MAGIARTVANMNGVLVVYAMGIVNAVLALVVSFGLNLTEEQQGSIVALVNALLVMVAHAAHANAKHTKAVIPPRPLDERSVAGEGEA